MKKGNFTIEAAILVPLLLFIFMLAIQYSIDMYREACGMEESYLTEEIWVVDTFYKDDLDGGYFDGEN